jgi:dolichyl-phosphate-mannose-protein mannosyltransferase
MGQPSETTQHATPGSSLDQSSELGADTLSLLFPPTRPDPAPSATPTPMPASIPASIPAPRVTRQLDGDAPLDESAGRPAPQRARTTHPLSALEIETQRLERPRPAIETETQRLSRPRQTLGGAPEQRAPASPVTEAPTQRLPPGDHVADAETLRLPPGSGLTEAETLRLAPATPLLEGGAETGWSARLGGPDYTLPLPITPETLGAPYSPRWSAEDVAALEDALDKEASAALAALSDMMAPEYPDLGEAPSLVAVRGARPTPPLADDEPPDETQLVVRALRQDISARESVVRRAVAALTQPSLIIMALFAVIEMATLPLWGARVAPDEITSLAAGLRAAQGFDLSQGAQALAHVMGTLIWLGVAGAGYQLGGLVGARAVAIVCVAIAGLATAAAAKNLFGAIAGLFTAIVFALTGPVIYLAHLAVPDQLALVGMAVSLWAITQAAASRRDGWLLVAVCAFSVGVIAWSPALLGLIPLIGVALALRGRPSLTTLYVVALVVAAIVMSRVFPAPTSALAIIPHRSRAGLSLSLSVSALSLETLYDGFVVWALAVAGWGVARRWKGELAAALVVGMLVWPAYVALAGDGANIERRLAFGFVFGLPLAGAAFAALQSASARSDALRWARVAVLLLAIAATGVAQAWAYHGWSGLIAPHAIHVVVGKADVGAPAAPLAGYAAPHREGAVFTSRR